MNYVEPILTILLPIGIGIGLLQLGIFDGEDGRRLRGFCMKFTVPLLVFTSMYNSDIGVFSQFGPIVFSLVIMTAGFFCIGYLGSLAVKERTERAAIHASTTFGNYAWIGWVVAKVVLGPGGFQRAVFFTVMWWPIFYTFGLLIGVVHHEPEQRDGVVFMVLKKFAPAAVALIAGISFNLAGINLPGIVFNTVKTFGDMTLPLILLSVGLHLRFSALVGFFPKAMLVSALRIIIGPIIGIGTALLCRLLFDIDVTSMRVIILNGAMPVATTTILLGDNYPMKTEIVGASIVLSTLLSLVTLPIWIPLAEKIPV
ncbi:MAG: hypothetical protein HN368_05175 [Spirochaetales bacterium]|nr:hypothetical protein [Spirochaetales bacterium]